MSVPPPTDDELADVPEDAEFDEDFWRDYAVSIAGYREEFVEEMIDERGVAGLVAELNP